MTPLWTKLNWKGQAPILLLDAPESFAAERTAMADIPCLSVVPEGVEHAPLPYVLAFVTTRQRVAEIASLLERSTGGDTVVWLAYPKGSSRRWHSEVNRDQGWEPLRALGFDTVRQVAIDEDWSALRFRRTAYIGR